MSPNFTIEEKFNAAVEIVQNLPKEGPVSVSNDDKLEYYGLFKQATIGPCNTGRPGFWNVIEKMKCAKETLKEPELDRDAWNSMGNLPKEEAMERYVKKILKKIQHVEETHDTTEWLRPGPLHDKLQPKFEIIGRTKPGEMMEVHGKTDDLKETDESSNKEKAEDPLEIHRPATPGTATSASALSDTEYCDAVGDEEQLSRSRSSSYELHDSPRTRRPSNNSLRSYCERVEAELKRISVQIEKLNNSVESRHNMLISIFKKASIYMFVPKGLSWKTVIFFILWPFIAHFLLRYFRHLIPYRLQP